MATRVGNDELGREAVHILRTAGLDTSYIQTDDLHPTGTVNVTIDDKGHASYEFAANTAWDHMATSPDWAELAATADAVCFGTLAQRSTASQSTIRSFLESLKPDALCVFDVNLRQAFYTADVLRDSLHHADILKLNEQELPVLATLLDISGSDDRTLLTHLCSRFSLSLACYTRSDRGCLFVSPDAYVDHPGHRVRVADTIGAGDAFTASVIHDYLRGRPLAEMAERASRRGAWVATMTGAMPDPATYNDAAFERA